MYLENNLMMDAKIVENFSSVNTTVIPLYTGQVLRHLLVLLRTCRFGDLFPCLCLCVCVPVCLCVCECVEHPSSITGII